MKKTMSNNSTTTKLNGFIKELAPICVCEILIIIATVIGAILLDIIGIFTFNYTVVSGVCLGAVMAILNYLFLTMSVDRQIKRYIELRGQRQMSEEEATKFTAQHAAAVQGAMKLSFIVRTASIGVALVVSFITGLFNPVATAIPLLSFGFALSAIELFKRRNAPKPNPDNFIKYDFNDEDTEKEDD